MGNPARQEVLELGPDIRDEPAKKQRRARINVFQQEGYLGRDTEIRYTGQGTEVAMTSIGIHFRTKKNGDWENTPTVWFDLVAFSKTAIKEMQELHKGDKVLVIGEYRIRSWTDSEDAVHVRQQIHAKEVRLLQAKADRQAQEESHEGEQEEIDF